MGRTRSSIRLRQANDLRLRDTTTKINKYMKRCHVHRICKVRHGWSSLAELEPWGLFFFSFYLPSSSSPFHFHHPHLAAPLLSGAHCGCNSLRCTKTDLKTHTGGWGGVEKRRGSRGGGGIECIFVKLLYCMPHSCTRRERPWSKDPEDGMFASLKTTLLVRWANKQTIGIIRCPTVSHIQMSGAHPGSLFKNVASVLT